MDGGFTYRSLLYLAKYLSNRLPSDGQMRLFPVGERVPVYRSSGPRGLIRWIAFLRYGLAAARISPWFITSKGHTILQHSKKIRPGRTYIHQQVPKLVSCGLFVQIDFNSFLVMHKNVDEELASRLKQDGRLALGRNRRRVPGRELGF